MAESVTAPFRFEIAPASLSGRRVKAGFHCHTVSSDGGLSPEETAERYHAKGFQCLGITDHGQVVQVDRLPGEDFIAIGATENGGTPDIIAVGVHTPVPRGRSLSERATMLSDQGGFTIAAHPTYCGVLPGVYAECADLMAIEIYNAYCDAAYANGYALELWDMVLGLGKRVWGVAADDAHLNPKKRHYSLLGCGPRVGRDMGRRSGTGTGFARTQTGRLLLHAGAGLQRNRGARWHNSLGVQSRRASPVADIWRGRPCRVRARGFGPHEFVSTRLVPSLQVCQD